MWSTWVAELSVSNAAEMLAAVSLIATCAGVVPLDWNSSPKAVASEPSWATVIVTSALPLLETMILSTWVLALSALKAVEMFAAVSLTATLSGVVPLAWNSSPKAVVSDAACETLIVTSLVALSETMILSTWVLALSASKAEDRLAAVSWTATWAGVVPLDWNSSPSAVPSDAACDAVIVTSAEPLLLTTILSTWLLAFSASKADEMFAAVSETATWAGVVPLAWTSSPSAVLSVPACAALIVTSLVTLSETTILSRWVLELSASKLDEMFAAASLTAALSGVVPPAWNSSARAVLSDAACATVIVTSLVALSETMILSTWVLELSASNAEEMLAAVSETATCAGVTPPAWNSSPRAVVSDAACETLIVTSFVALFDTMILSTWVLALSSLKAVEMFAAVSLTATLSGVVPPAWNSSPKAVVSDAACETLIVTSLVALSETMILSTWVLAFSASKAEDRLAAVSWTATWAGVVPLDWTSSPSAVVSAAA